VNRSLPPEKLSYCPVEPDSDDYPQLGALRNHLGGSPDHGPDPWDMSFVPHELGSRDRTMEVTFPYESDFGPDHYGHIGVRS